MRRAEGKVELALVQGDASDPRGAPRVTRTGPATPAARPPLNRHSRRKQQQRRRRG
jgi:hypothetical protein